MTATEAIADQRRKEFYENVPAPTIVGQGVAGYDEMVRLLRTVLLGYVEYSADPPRVCDALLGLQVRISHLELTGVPMELGNLFRGLPQGQQDQQDQQGQQGQQEEETEPAIPSLQPRQ